jgi:heme A synthase
MQRIEANLNPQVRFHRLFSLLPIMVIWTLFVFWWTKRRISTLKVTSLLN